MFKIYNPVPPHFEIIRINNVALKIELDSSPRLHYNVIKIIFRTLN